LNEPKKKKTRTRQRSVNRHSLDEYHSEGMAQALRRFQGPKGAAANTLSADAVREMINGLPDNSNLQTTTSDFWLNLSRDEGRHRRAFDPPQNPFKKQGRDKLARKDLISAWDYEWRMDTVVRFAEKVFASSGAKVSQDIANHLRQNFAWLEHDQDGLCGNLMEMPVQSFVQAIQQPELLRVRQMTVGQAVVRRWADRKEQTRWLERYVQAIEIFQKEVKTQSRS
jgi:hypothetical protein